jgi:hypothetical protein
MSNELLMVWRGDRVDPKKPNPLADDVTEAAAHYESKYKKPATVAFIHPDRAAKCVIGAIRVEHDWNICNIDEIFIGA